MFKRKDLLLASAMGLLLTLSPAANGQSAAASAPKANKERQVFVVSSGKRLGIIAEKSDNGVRVREVVKDSPAAKVGIQTGDIISEVNGKKVTSVSDLRARLNNADDDKPVNLQVLRNGSTLKFSAKLEERDTPFVYGYGQGYGQSEQDTKRALERAQRALEKSYESRKKALAEMEKNLSKSKEEREQARREREKAREERRKEFEKARGEFTDRLGALNGDRENIFVLGGRTRLGVSLNELTEQLGKYFGVEKGQGVLVASVQENSAAAKAGLKAGDIILEINGIAIKNSFDVRKEINKVEAGEVRITVIRDKQRLELRPQLEAKPKGPELGYGSVEGLSFPEALGRLPGQAAPEVWVAPSAPAPFFDGEHPPIFATPEPFIPPTWNFDLDDVEL